MSLPNWLQISATSGSGDVIITLTAATYTELTARTASLRISATSHYADLTVNQNAYVPEPEITAITFNNLSWAVDVPASGGTADKDNCVYLIYAYYDNGSSVDVSASATVTGSVSVASSSTITRHSAGTLTLTATYSGFTTQGNVTIYQQAATPIATDIIYYTSTDGNIVTPYNEYNFGANIVSNTYDGDVGMISFDGDVTSFGSQVFDKCGTLKSIIIPNSVTSIGDYAFRKCTSLTSVTIPNSVTSIGYLTFASCTTLSSITIPSNVNSIGSDSFLNCINLRDVTIENGVTSIGYGAFYGCTLLNRITLPISITKIREAAFKNCSNMAYVICYATTPPTLEDSAFDNTNNCPIYVPTGTDDAYKIANNWSDYESRIYPFEGMSFNPLTWAVDVPANGGTADKDNCIYTIYYNHYLSGISFDATASATVTGSVYVPASTTSARTSAGTLTLTASYSGFTGKGKATIYQEGAVYGIIPSAITIDYDDTNFLITTYVSEELTVGFPYFVSGITPNIANVGFNSHSGATYINFADSARTGEITLYNPTTEEIKYRATITQDAWDALPTPSNNQIIYRTTDNNSITANTEKFYTHYYTQTYNSEHNYWTMAFQEDLDYIPENFMKETNLKEISFPDSVTYIGEEAFYGCDYLDEVKFSSNSKLSRINDDAFYNTNLLRISLPDSLVDIGNYGIYGTGDTRIQSVSFGPNLKDIDAHNFWEFPKINKLYFYGEEEPNLVYCSCHGAWPFDGVASTGTLYCPNSGYTDVKNALPTGWTQEIIQSRQPYSSDTITTSLDTLRMIANNSIFSLVIYNPDSASNLTYTFSDNTTLAFNKSVTTYGNFTVADFACYQIADGASSAQTLTISNGTVSKTINVLLYELGSGAIVLGSDQYLTSKTTGSTTIEWTGYNIKEVAATSTGLSVSSSETSHSSVGGTLSISFSGAQYIGSYRIQINALDYRGEVHSKIFYVIRR